MSVIIPAFNAERWIADALHSVTTQSWTNLEVIVVDDGSLDSTATIAESCVDARVTVIRQANRGASAARNAGLAHSKGALVQFLDADDLLHRDKISLQVEAMSRNGFSVVASGEWGRFFGCPKQAAFVDRELWLDLDAASFLRISLSRNLMMHPAAWLIPRTIVERAGPWNEQLSLNDDGEYFSRVVAISGRIQFVAGAKSYYRSGVSGSLSSRRSAKAYSSALLAARLSAAELMKLDSSEAARDAVASLFERLAVEAFPLALNVSREAAKYARAYGSRGIAFHGGRMTTAIGRLIGWRMARLAQLMSNYLRSVKRS